MKSMGSPFLKMGMARAVFHHVGMPSRHAGSYSFSMSSLSGSSLDMS